MNQWGGTWGDSKTAPFLLMTTDDVIIIIGGTFMIRRGTNEAGIESAILAGIPNFAGVPVEFVPYPNATSSLRMWMLLCVIMMLLLFML